MASFDMFIDSPNMPEMGDTYLDKRPDVGCWDAVFMGDAIVDDPHRLCV